MRITTIVPAVALVFFISACTHIIKTNQTNSGIENTAAARHTQTILPTNAGRQAPNSSSRTMGQLIPVQSRHLPLSTDGRINVMDYGATGDGVTDDTASLSNAANSVNATAGQILFFPTGVYLTDGLSLRPNTQIVGDNHAVLKGRSGSNNILTLACGVKIENMQIDGNKNTMSGGNAVYGRSVSNIEISGSHIHDCKDKCVQIVNSTEFKLSNNRIENADHQCVEIDFSSNGIITGNTIDTCAHGIQWWGGDASTTSPPGVSNLLIARNMVKNVTVQFPGHTGGGGIWGSRGERVTISDNDVENCNDVGIDTEGGINDKITGNNVHNARTTAIATFYGSSQLTISGNEIHQDRDFGYGIHIHSGANKISSHLTIADNKIHTANSQGISTDQNALVSSVIQDNTIVVDSAEKGIRILEGTQVDILRNQIQVNSPTAVSLEGPSDSTIADNVIETNHDNSSPGGLNGGIFIYWRSNTFPAKRNIIKNNFIKGFTTSINDNCWGDLNSGTTIEENHADTIYQPRGTHSGPIEGNVSLDDQNNVITPTGY